MEEREEVTYEEKEVRSPVRGPVFGSLGHDLMRKKKESDEEEPRTCKEHAKLK